MTRRICANFFFQGQKKTLVHYNLHWKTLHPAFKKISQLWWHHRFEKLFNVSGKALRAFIRELGFWKHRPATTRNNRELSPLLVTILHPLKILQLLYILVSLVYFWTARWHN